MSKDIMFFVGLDLGDRRSDLVVLDKDGELVEESRVPTTPTALERKFSTLPRSRIALEVGPHSRWASQLLEGLGHEVLVANARKVRAIFDNPRKADRPDAQTLARLARLDPALLSPIRHRSAQAQADLAILRSRDALVRSRTLLINHVRGTLKSFGARQPSCSAECFPSRAAAYLPRSLTPSLLPVLETIGGLTRQIRSYDHQIEALCQTRYPEVQGLRGIGGVGALTALAYVLTLEDPARFAKSRHVGPALGLVPRRDQSGGHDPQLRITKTGDAFLRRLLVGSAQYILGPFGPDCDLRHWGLALAERGGKNAKKRAVVAVARKLAVLMHRLWKTGETYDPLWASRTAASHARQLPQPA
ncbi:MAG: IS110 family transposase [Deinococcota bacterium]